MLPNLNHLLKKRVSFFVIASTLVLIIGFQNCGKGFKAQNELSLSSNSQGTPLVPAPPVITPVTPSNVDIPILTNRATKLSDTAFFSKMTDTTKYINFQGYEPQYPLYSDGATKKRWAYLPKDTTINTMALDAWEYPLGTAFWKEFSVDGRKVETRVMEKVTTGVGTAAWRASVYLWKTDQSDADLLTVNDFYTNPIPEQDIYEARAVQAKYKVAMNTQCMNCHRGGSDVVLGFSYLQLSSKSLAVNIQTLSDQKLLSHPPINFDEIKGDSLDKAAIGYIQGNCVHCHNGSSTGCLPNLKHSSANLTRNDENIIKAGSANTALLSAGNPANSILYQRFTGAIAPRMPLLGSNIVDPTAEKTLGDWIKGLTLP